MEFTPQAKRAFHMQSYGPGPSIDGIELVELKRFADDAGTLTELARLSEGRAAAAVGLRGRRRLGPAAGQGRCRRTSPPFVLGRRRSSRTTTGAWGGSSLGPRDAGQRASPRACRHGT